VWVGEKEELRDGKVEINKVKTPVFNQGRGTRRELSQQKKGDERRSIRLGKERAKSVSGLADDARKLWGEGG